MSVVFGTEEMDKLNAILRANAKVTAEHLTDLLAWSQTFKPSATYDSHIAQIRDYYEGNQIPYVRAAILKAFPETGHLMPAAAMNMVAHMAEQDASSYDKPVIRYIKVDGKRPIVDRLPGADGKPLPLKKNETVVPEHVQRQKDFDRMHKTAETDVFMQEVERRVMASKCGFVRVNYDMSRKALGKEGRLRLIWFWSDHVRVIPHPHAPGDIQAALAVLLRVKGPGGRHQWWEVWSRTVQNDDSGSPIAYGPIRAEMIQEETGKIIPMFDGGNYPLPTYPIIPIYDGVPTGVFLDYDRDIISTQDTFNVTWSYQLHNLYMNAHPNYVFRGNKEGKEFVGGPGGIFAVDDDEQFDALASDVSPETLNTLKEFLAQVAIMHEQESSAFTSEAGPPLSGYSRMVQRQPQLKARAKRIGRYKTFEQHLNEVMIEQYDYWHKTAIGHYPRSGKSIHKRDDWETVSQFSKPDDFTEPMAKTERSERAQAKGWISPAQAATDADHYVDVDHAVSKGLSDQLQLPEAAAMKTSIVGEPLAGAKQVGKTPPANQSGGPTQ